MIKIREENPADHDAIRTVNDRAFGQTAEGRLVDKIRQTCQATISLIALAEDEVVGHIFFTPVTVDNGGHIVMGLGLGPMAVLPSFQNQGVGSMLVREGLRRIRETHCPFIIVLGHENYYPRFGFQKASDFGLKPQWPDIPDNAFMAMILKTEEMQGITGVVCYRDEFNEAL